MRALVLLLTVLALGACKDQMERSQADINKGNPEGQQLKKKYEEAAKQRDEQLKKGP